MNSIWQQMMVAYNHVHICQSMKGVRKQDNEDNYLVIENERYDIYAIFDGVGSALNSKQATNLAKEFIIHNYTDYFRVQISLDKLMRDCNSYIVNTQIPESFTTFCILVILKNSSHKVIYSSLGDSRIYLITKQFIEQITIDDKVYNANVLTKCLGMTNLENDDFNQNTIDITHENLLLCTDGFYDFLEENRMQFFEVFNRSNLQSIKQRLISLVTGQNRDDATFILIR